MPCEGPRRCLFERTLWKQRGRLLVQFLGMLLVSMNTSREAGDPQRPIGWRQMWEVGTTQKRHDLRTMLCPSHFDISRSNRCHRFLQRYRSTTRLIEECRSDLWSQRLARSSPCTIESIPLESRNRRLG